MPHCYRQTAEIGYIDTNHYSYPDRMAKMSNVSRSAENGNGLTVDGRVSVWLPDLSAGRLGGFSTLNISEWPNDAAVCSLSQILETGPIPHKYYLSAKACRGIVRRAEKRGKALPLQLERALQAVADKPTLTEELSAPG